MKKLTIIIPSYNQQDYLSDAIESALVQTVPCDIIVVDDGSTDSSLEIARGYENIRVISQLNKGLASARNTAIMNTTTDWILPLDADDMLKGNAVEKILEVIEKDPYADIVAPSFKTFGTTNQEIILQNANVFDFIEANRIGYFSAVRKSKLLECGGYSPKMVWGFEDWHCWIDLLNRGAKLVTMKDVLVLYRTKAVSMITEAEKHRSELEAQIKKDFKDLFI